MAFSNFSRTALLGGAALLLVSTGAFAGVQGSKHDLGSTGGAQQKVTAGATSEVCVFCHTPHGADTGASAPLWNKRLQSGTYTRYSSLNTSTLDGTEVGVGSISLACLSCHDGTQAMDVVINQPGSGGWVATGTEIDSGAVGAMTGTPVPNLTQDLSDDHPISIEYAGGACTNTTGLCAPSTAGVAGSDPDFRDAQFATINTNPNWWVDVASGSVGGTAFSGTAGSRDKTDMLLYTRAFTGGNGPSVECGSCHDPHSDASNPVSFLRIDNDGSAVCLACHIK